jgi:hypothetical protein
VADEFAGEAWPSGSVYRHLLHEKDALKRTGQWNRLTITCKDRMIWVLLNGEQVISMNRNKWTSSITNPNGSQIPSSLYIPLAELATHGRIGLQGRFTGAIVYYRNSKIRELELSMFNS